MAKQEEIIAQLKALAKNEKIFPSIGNSVIQHNKSNNSKLFLAFTQNRFYRGKDFREFLNFLNENENKISFLLDAVQLTNGEQPEIEVEDDSELTLDEGTKEEEKDTLSEVIEGTISK